VSTDPEFNEIVRSITDHVPVSFLSPAERRKRRPNKVDQLALCDEPDHDQEKSRRAQLSAMRNAGKGQTFQDAVRRRREQREREDREIAPSVLLWTTTWWTWTWHELDATLKEPTHD
jgi:hypothetical protein